MIADFGKKRLKFYKNTGAFLIILTFAGCAQKITKQEIKKLEDFDPQFRAILDKRRNLEPKISSLENQIASEKAELQAKVSVLRRDFEKRKTRIEAQIQDARAQLAPERKLLRERMVKLNQEFRLKLNRLRDIKAMLKETKSLAEKSKNTNIALQEKDRWNEQISTLEKEKEKVGREISVLKEKIRLYKLGLRAIK